MWDARLAAIDGDPARQDWARFRPLRLGREEDWADWLAHLLETSPNGHFAGQLLRRGATRDVVVNREVLAPGTNDDGTRRLDLVVCWGGAERTHLEMKVGDQSFAKTVDTARLIEKHQPGRWCHVLLVPPEDETRADGAVKAAAGAGPTIEVMTWRHVARALRACLWNACGTTPWRVPARTFVGAVEQRLLNVGPVAHADRKVTNAAMLKALLEESQDERHV